MSTKCFDFETCSMHHKVKSIQNKYQNFDIITTLIQKSNFYKYSFHLVCPLSALTLLQVGLHQLLRVSAARHRGEDVPVQNIASPNPVSSPASGQAP